jgi:FkbM family methyltransferase
MIKSAFKGLLKRSGFHLFTNGSLPPGVDWLLDLKKLGLHASVIFFDVGANVGQTIFEVRASFPQASIFAFEPFPVTFGTLRECTAHLKNVRIFPLALGASPGALQVNTRQNSVLNSLVGAAQATESAPYDAGSVLVTMDSLQNFCAQHEIDVIDVLKTDTEGYDLEVLRGAGELLGAGRVRYVYAEVTFCAQNRQNTPFSPLFDYLAEKNFRLLGLYETYTLHHFPEPNVFCNALFVHRSHHVNTNHALQSTPKAFSSRRADGCMNRFSIIRYLLSVADCAPGSRG